MRIMNIIVCVICLLLIANRVSAHNTSHLGQIYFPTTGKPAAQPSFEKGVMYLHSFQYDEARVCFRQAEKIDPEFALAYWGEALTYNHPLWGEQQYDQAVKVLKRFAPTADTRVNKTKSAKEKGLMNAVNQLYGAGNKVTRDRHYMDALRELYRQYPQDDEIATLYSLALLGTAESERNARTYMQSAGVTEDVFSRNKKHPGALHYLIHAYDDPIHAPLGLRAARAYAKIAPSASHALHMPSHIYTALGLWDEVIQSNQAAWNAGRQQNSKQDPAAYTIHDLHALQWLAYAHLQKKHYATAYQLTKTMESIAQSTSTPMAKWYYGLMRASYLSDSGDYNAKLSSLSMNHVELSAYASNIYADVLQAKSQGDSARMKSLLDELVKVIPVKYPNQTYSDYFTSVTKSGILTARIIELEIRAQIAMSEKQSDKAIQYLKRAGKLEAQTSFGYGPPIPVKPSFELLAEILLKEKKYGMAYQQYIITLKRLPNRTFSAEGEKMTKKKLLAHKLPLPEGINPYFHRLILPEFYH